MNGKLLLGPLANQEKKGQKKKEKVSCGWGKLPLSNHLLPPVRQTQNLMLL